MALRETALALTYRAQVTPWLVVPPDLQLVINTGADPALKTARVASPRLQVTWGRQAASSRSTIAAWRRIPAGITSSLKS